MVRTEGADEYLARLRVDRWQVSGNGTSSSSLYDRGRSVSVTNKPAETNIKLNTKRSCKIKRTWVVRTMSSNH